MGGAEIHQVHHDIVEQILDSAGVVVADDIEDNKEEEDDDEGEEGEGDEEGWLRIIPVSFLNDES